MAVTDYIWDPVTDSYLMEKDDAGTTTAVYTNEPRQFGGLISQRRGADSSFYHFDALGSTRALTGGAATITDTNLYDAWGVDVAFTGTTENPFRWVGELGYYKDTEAAEYYVRERTYYPKQSRWLNKDLAWPGIVEDLPYLYARNSPTNLVDPSGQCAGTDCDDKKGIVTIWDPTPTDSTCKHPCKIAIVTVHEAEHRRNMKECCERRNKCIAAYKRIGGRQGKKGVQLCRRGWALWKGVNRVSLELRAAAQSCDAAIWIAAQACCGVTFPNIYYNIPRCCDVALDNFYLCSGDDPTAHLEGCPFDKQGVPDPKQLNRLIQIHEKLQEENGK